MLVRNVRSHSSRTDLLDTLVRALHRRVVDQDIELAEFLHSAVDERLAISFIRNIPRHQDRAAAGLFNPVLGLLRVIVLLQIGDQDIGTLARESDRHGSADPESAPVMIATLPARRPLPL